VPAKSTVQRYATWLPQEEMREVINGLLRKAGAAITHGKQVLYLEQPVDFFSKSQKGGLIRQSFDRVLDIHCEFLAYGNANQCVILSFSGVDSKTDLTSRVRSREGLFRLNRLCFRPYTSCVSPIFTFADRLSASRTSYPSGRMPRRWIFGFCSTAQLLGSFVRARGGRTDASNPCPGELAEEPRCAPSGA
jgi:hypothetical protein